MNYLKSINYQFHKKSVSEFFIDFLEADWTKVPYIFVLIFSFILTRIFLLNLGFGADPDIWRIANSAFDLRYSHIYLTSRFPGFPFPEYINSVIINGGWLATNSVTLILSLISVIIFAKILNYLNVKNKGLLVLTYAFLPILWINSTNTMDYMWALTFIIIAWFLVLRKQYCLAGLAMGLAIGSRITSGFIFLPLLYLIWMESRKIKNIFNFVIVAAVTSSLLFLPLFIQYNLKFLAYFPMPVSLYNVGADFYRVFGIPALIFTFLALMFSLKKIIKMNKKDKDTMFLILIIVLVCAMFIKTPYETEYLIPVIPFGLLFLNKIFRRRFMVLLCILLILHSCVCFDFVNRDDFGNLDFHVRVEDGVIKKNIEARVGLMDHTQNLINADVRNHSVVIIGWYLPVLSYLVSFTEDYNVIRDPNGNWEKDISWNWRKDIWYRYVVPLDELLDLQDRGYNIYYIEEMREYTKSVHGYDLNDYNCTPFYFKGVI